MDNIFKTILKHKKLCIVAFLILSIICAILSFKVRINYNLNDYLPSDSQTQQALNVLDKNFGINGSAELMLKVKDQEEAIEFKQKINAIDGVQAAIWYDDYKLLTQINPNIKKTLEQEYYIPPFARYLISFEENDSSLKTEKALSTIRQTFKENAKLRGEAINLSFTKQGSFEDIKSIAIYASPLLVIVLVFMLKSFIQAGLIFFSLFISLVLNMGSNIVLNRVSFFAIACMAILQFAISIDYSIFLLHSYKQERELNKNPNDAMLVAIKRSISTLLSSCLTTVAGMLTLAAMKYSIGLDIGLVLAKGVIINLICSLSLLPCLVLIFDKHIKNKTHKNKELSKVYKFILKHRIVVIVVFLLILIPSIFLQQKLEFLYGGSALAGSPKTKIYQEAESIKEVFGIKEPLLILMPKGDSQKEYQMANELKENPYVSSIQSLYSFINPNTPSLFIPAEYQAYLEGPTHSRAVLYINQSGEGENVEKAINSIRDTVEKYYDNALLLSASLAALEIKQQAKYDYIYVMLLLIVSIFIIISISFKNISIAIILLISIQSAIFINMAFSLLYTRRLLFIGYIVVSSLQLGATIDYAILLMRKYIQERSIYPPNLAIINALKLSTNSIITSSGILMICGICGALASRISAIAQLVLLVGLGALFSLGIVMLVIPSICILFDKFIYKEK